MNEINVNKLKNVNNVENATVNKKSAHILI